MDYQKFYEWLKNCTGMSDRSSRDIVPRLKRVTKIMGLTQVYNITIEIIKKRIFCFININKISIKEICSSL